MIFKKYASISLISNNYYIFAILVSYFSIYMDIIRVGFINSIFMVCMFVQFLFKTKKIYLSKISFLIIFYIIYNIMHIFVVKINGYSIIIAIKEFSSVILPMIFYFIAKRMNEKEEQNFIKAYIASSLFMVFIGIYMYIFKPDIYFNFIEKTYMNFLEETYTLAPRMYSFVGSVAVGTMSSISLSFLLNYMVVKNNYIKYSFFAIVFIISVILSMQRSAYIFVIIVFGMFYMYLIRKKSYLKITVFLLIIFMISLFVLKYYNLTEFFIYRVESITSAASERNNNWGMALEYGFKNIMGSGLGTGGHRAIGISNITIADGYYVKIIYETGVISFILFISIIILVINKGLTNYKKNLVYLSIIVGVLFQCIGSNILGFQLLAPIFWFSVGKIDSC